MTNGGNRSGFDPLSLETGIEGLYYGPIKVRWCRWNLPGGQTASFIEENEIGERTAYVGSDPNLRGRLIQGAYRVSCVLSCESNSLEVIDAPFKLPEDSKN